ncbi:hypothetical protein GCM10012275_07220 [Longimycelium tulufanense]|uniref:Uncharacterized protein n=1 Tax=Longimycelium tulufanense TaxID=907463 RepID=A0A8J3C6A6_9PSEU|nr:cobalamin biosynthesis protein [Longimycelium tulufanense]GGM38867.1 hypothetical protein GCM10012275_07220 [Longimycelium tulufanense]
MIGLFAATATGRRSAAVLASHLGPDAVVAEGPVRPALRRLWPRLRAMVFFLAPEDAIRLVGPMLSDRQTDPAVVCVDDAHRYAVVLSSGTASGGNALAQRVGEVLDCVPVTSAAGDAVGSTPLDELVELLDAAVEGDLAQCGIAVLEGAPVRLVNPMRFPLPAMPPNVGEEAEGPEWTVLVEDRIPVEPEQLPEWPGWPVRPASGKLLRLVPRTLVVGIGATGGVSTTAVTSTLSRLQHEHGLDLRAVRSFATVDRKAGERGIVEAVEDHGFWHAETAPPLLRYSAANLSEVDVPNPSAAVREATGTPSVAEAAALLAAREHAGGGRIELIVEKIVGDNVTVAAARVYPRGRLAVVGLGPGPADLRTPRAEAELLRAAAVIGPSRLLGQVRHLIRPGTRAENIIPGAEAAAADRAVALAAAGSSVVLLDTTGVEAHDRVMAAVNRSEQSLTLVTVPGLATEELSGESE